ncbi:MAG: hypothetical protein AAFY26_04760 [Cyanobacteria bacterium J06638_22]
MIGFTHYNLYCLLAIAQSVAATIQPKKTAQKVQTTIDFLWKTQAKIPTQYHL